MADLNKGFKGIFMKGMEAISDTASKIATTTKYKVDEMNIINRRREILTDFGAQSYALWKKGEQFPAELDELLKELDQLESELESIKADRAPKAEPVEEASFEDKVEDVMDKVEDSLQSVGKRVEKAAEALKDAVMGDDEEAAVPVIEVEEEAAAQDNAADAPETKAEEVPTIKVEE